MHILTDKNGKEHVVSDAIFERYIREGSVEDTVPNGGRIRVPIMLMDGAPYQPPTPQFHDGLGHPAGTKPGWCFPATTSDAAARAYEEFRTRLSDAWKDRSAGQAYPPPVMPRVTGDARADAYAEMCTRLSTNWRRSA